MDPTQLTDFILAKKWIAVTALVIGLVVRLLKSDTKIPFDLPPRYRSLLALALGAGAGALEKLVLSGETSWTKALVNGLGAAVIAILGHDVLIGGLRDGKELVLPGLIVPGKAPAPGKPPSIPPAAVLLLVVGLLGLGSSGCALFTRGNARTLIDIAQTACIIAHQDLPDSDVAKVCDITDPLLGPMREILASSRATSAKAAADASARAGAARCVAP